MIYKNVRLSESEVEGLPIIMFDKRASGAQNYEALAEEILDRASCTPVLAAASAG